MLCWNKMLDFFIFLSFFHHIYNIYCVSYIIAEGHDGSTESNITFLIIAVILCQILFQCISGFDEHGKLSNLPFRTISMGSSFELVINKPCPLPPLLSSSHLAILF